MNWTDTTVASIHAQLSPNPRNRFGRRPFPASPLGMTPEGRQDFRRLPLPQSIRNMDIADVDLTRARSRPNRHGTDALVGFWSCRGRNVSFERAGRFHRIDGIYDHCRFDRITSDNGVIFSGIFRNCSFLRTNLKGASLAGEFVNCSFDGANLNLRSWNGSFAYCSFVDCRHKPGFRDVAEVAQGAGVTFSVTADGAVRPGQSLHVANVGQLDVPW